MSVLEESNSSGLAEEFRNLEEAERKARSDEEYTFTDLEEDTTTTIAGAIALDAVDIDEEEEEIVLHEESFDLGIEYESFIRGYADRPIKMELGVLAASIAGLGASVWNFWKSGDPIYASTGALSTYSGKKAYDRIRLKKGAENSDNAMKREIEQNIPDVGDYTLKVLSEQEVKEYVEQKTGLNVYTKEELEDMSGDELKQVIEEDVYS